VAVLAADVAGYSRLMGADEEGTLAQLKAIRKTLVDPTIAAHRGRIVKTTGDGMLVEFASAVDAARGAAEVQRSMAKQNTNMPQDARIEFRIGIHVGDIIVDDNDIFGDGVNIAARLEGIAEPGGICVSDDAQRQIRGKIDLAFDDMGPQSLKNIAEPMRAWRLQIDKDCSPTVHKRAVVEAAQPLALPDKPSIAVLPFQNMSGDPEQEYFADGIVEDIITALSRFRPLLVIARNTSFTYKGKAVDIKQVGRELGVRYVLEGSVRKAGGRLRITGQLIEAATGAHLWADKVDGALEDVFDLQDQVTSSVVGAIAPAMQLAETERARRKPTANLDSYDLFLRGSAAVWEGRLKDAIAYFKQAIDKDDRYAEAYGLCAGAYVVLQSYSGTAVSAEEQAEAVRFADLAATLGTDDALTLVRAAQALAYFGRQYDRALAMSDRAVALNPNLASVWLVRGWINSMCCNFEETMNSFSRVLQFSELDPARIGAYCGISYGCAELGKYEEGCAWAEKALQKYENALYFIPLIANAVGAMREDKARNAVARLLKIAPNFQVSRMGEFIRRRSSLEALAKVLREAGLPE
jgi:TolB-like protein/class 3 adenylate cyclase